MSGLLYLLLLGTLIVVAKQDFQHRAIWWGLIPILLGTGLTISCLEIGWEKSGLFLVLNTIFLSVQFLAASLYFSFKNRQLTNIVDQYIGLGDILFLVAIASLFSPINFVLVYILGLLLVLITAFIFKFLFNKNNTIPLAGALSILLIGCIFFDYLAQWNRYNVNVLSYF